MSNFEHDYVKLVSSVIQRGEHRESRAGDTISVFGTMLQIDALEHGYFPILTQRKIFLQGILGELAAFLRGAEDLQTFKDFGCNYWDANATAWHPNENLEPKKQIVGRIYGAQWRNWEETTDQIADLVHNLKNNPFSRRHLLTTYNPAELEDMCLPPCHLLAQFNVRTTKHLDCVVYMRSVDLCLGLPSDLIVYATLMLLLCKETGYAPGKLTFMLGDTHVYKNHVDTFYRHTQREMHQLPLYQLHSQAELDYFEPSDLILQDYQHSGVLKYEFSV
jgi:thymidylate synthase